MMLSVVTLYSPGTTYLPLTRYWLFSKSLETVSGKMLTPELPIYIWVALAETGIREGKLVPGLP